LHSVASRCNCVLDKFAYGQKKSEHEGYTRGLENSLGNIPMAAKT